MSDSDNHNGWLRIKNTFWHIYPMFWQIHFTKGNFLTEQLQVVLTRNMDY